uniref:EphrinA-b ephrin n=1 Tax=Phallusia mammillata TaxID=59560 RepID=A0A6F9DCF4_9ASCI|nr:EphrinA-b ephrin precursor [Phallusia mammillata]
MRIAIIVLFLLTNAKVGITNRRVSHSKEVHEITWDPKVTNGLGNGQIYHINVKMNEYMDIFCPQYDADAPEAQVLKFVIYNVSYQSFQACTKTNEAKKIFNCSSPITSRKLTTKFQRRSPNPLGFVFKPDSDYYYIAFTDEDKKGCENAMRMHIKVHHRDRVNAHTKVPTVNDNSSPKVPDVKPPPANTKSTTKKPTTTRSTTKKIATTHARTPKNGHRVGDPSVGGSGSPGAASTLRCSALWFLFICAMAILRN